VGREHLHFKGPYLTLGISEKEGAPTVPYMKFNVMYPELLGRVSFSFLSGWEESTFISRAHCVWFCALVPSLAGTN
jgi:hypothetical protein